MIKYLSFLCGLAFACGAEAEINPANVSKPAPLVQEVSPLFGHLDANQVSLGSVKAMVVDPATDTVLYSKNADLQAPIASITKLMTAMVILDAGQDLEERLEIRKAERETDKNGYSRMRIGSRLARADLLRIMLMASENLAATNLAYHYPGGFPAFIDAMNAKAKALSMHNTQFADASGLSDRNLSTAADLVKMLKAAGQYEVIREYSTDTQFTARFDNPRYALHYGNTNRLVNRNSWDVTLSKTGYLTEAGRCLVMITKVDGREVAMVLLDSFGKLTPIGDAGRIKRWLTTGNGGKVAGAALNYERNKSASYK